MATSNFVPPELPDNATADQVTSAVRKLTALARRVVLLGGDLTGRADAPRLSRTAIAAWHALFMHTDANMATANKDGTAATPSLRTLGVSSVQSTAGNDPRLSRVVPIVATPGVGPVWAAMPLAATEFLGGAAARFATNAALYTQFRLVANVAVAGAAAAVLRLRYHDGSGWVNAQDSGTTGDVSIAAAGLTIGTWVTLATGARQDRTFTLYGVGGNGIAAPGLNSVQVQFRVP